MHGVDSKMILEPSHRLPRASEEAPDFLQLKGLDEVHEERLVLAHRLLAVTEIECGTQLVTTTLRLQIIKYR